MTFIPGLQAVSFSSLGNVVPNGLAPGVKTALLVYQITGLTNLNDLLLTGVQIQVATNIGTKFTYSLYAGNPASGGRLLFDSPDTIFTNTQGYIYDNAALSTGYTYKSGAFASVSNADARAGVYVEITNLVSSGLTFDIAVNFLLVPPAAVALPAYTPSSSAYTGPSGLTSVDVGPGLTFTEPARALPYLAAGFTMTVHPGTYFIPFTIPSGMDGWTIQAAAGANADTVIFNGRGGFLTGVPPWTNNDPAVAPPSNPFRLAQGKGFITAYSPGAVSGIGFLDCGGGYGVANNTISIMQSEAGIWWGPASGNCYVTRCVFNGGANGIFTPPGGFTLTIDHCDFSLAVGCATEETGHTHNVYLENATVIVTNANFYAPENGHAFKSRSPSVTATNCFFQAGSSSSSSAFSGSGGRAFEMPDGGTGVLTNCRLSQKPTIQTSVNFVGFCNESYTNGAASSLTLAGCRLDVVRFDSRIWLGSSGGSATIAATSPTETVYTGFSSTVGIGYHPGDQGSGVTGLSFGNASTVGTPATVSAGLPPAVPSPAHLA